MLALRIWRKLQKIGLHEKLEFKQRIRIELCNRFVSIGLLMVFIHLVINALFLWSIPDLIVTFIWIALLVPGLLFNIYHRPKVARIFLVYSGTISICILHILFGPEIKLESMYILFVVSAALFFEFKFMVRTVGFIFFSFFLASLICLFYDAPLSIYISPTGPITRFVFSLVMIILLISKLIFENEAYNKIIQQQNIDLIESNQQLKSFNYIFSHDLREPVRSIISFSQLIQRDLDRGQGLNQEYFKYVIGSGNQLNSLLEGIKTFQDSTDKVLQSGSVSIQSIVHAVVSNFSEAQKKKNPKVNCQDLPLIESSKMAMFIIFKNLIDNAIKYNDQPIPEITITGKVLNQSLHIWVKDNGIGIEEHFLDDVFIMFKRLNSDREKGSGLGLSIVRSLMTKINGSISIEESSAQKGTTFFLSLPLRQSL